MYKEKIIDLLTGEDNSRDYSAEEIAKVEAAQAEAQAQAQAEAEAQAKRSTALAKLEALGLSLDDLEALGL